MTISVNFEMGNSVPRIVRIKTTSTLSQVTAAGWYKQMAPNQLQPSDKVEIYYGEGSTTAANALFDVTITAGVVTLGVSETNVTLPTIANRIATFTNTSGGLSEDPATAISGGNIQAGLSGTAGYLASFPSALTKGSLRLTAVANTGDTLVTLSNALHGQASVYSIPDSGATTANLILSKTTGTQHITVGSLQIDAGALSSGISTGGTAGGLTLYPATASNGSFVFTPVGNAGNFNTTVSPISTQGQSTVMTIPDVGAATGQFIVKTAALVSGNFLMASGTAGLVVDSGVPATGGQLFAQVSLSAAQFNGMYATPVQLVAAAGANTMIIIDNIQLQMTFVSAAYANGGVVSAQYDSTANGAGVHASSDEAAADFFATASTVFKLNGGLVLAPFTSCANKGIFLSNLTGAFTTGDSTWRIKVYYHVISTTA